MYPIRLFLHDRPRQAATLTCLLLVALTASGCSSYGDPLFCSTAMSYVPAKHAAEPPPLPLCYRAEPMYYGYHGTCWRPWPEGWTPCGEGCFLPPTMLPPAADGEQVQPGSLPQEQVPPGNLLEGEAVPPGNLPEEAVPPGVEPMNPAPQDSNRGEVAPPNYNDQEQPAGVYHRQEWIPPVSNRREPRQDSSPAAPIPAVDASQTLPRRGTAGQPSQAFPPALPEAAQGPPDSGAVLNGGSSGPMSAPVTNLPPVSAASSKSAVRVSLRQEKASLLTVGFNAETGEAQAETAEDSRQERPTVERTLRLYR